MDEKEVDGQPVMGRVVHVLDADVDIAARVNDEVFRSRLACYCGQYRKPCPYHEGMLDGTDVAARIWREAMKTAVIP
jgi:hypothetical protein